MSQPHLTFFCELESGPLDALFADPAVIEDLRALGASVSLGMVDFDPARAAVVRRLNDAGIPVVAWLLLPREQGYWFNLDNALQATARYHAFKAWTAEHNLRWERVGLDIEPNIHEMELIQRHNWPALLPRVAARLFDNERLRRAQVQYSGLAAEIRADGWPVDSYILFAMLDERRAGSTLIQRLGGLVDFAADREVPMLYTSLLRERGPGVLWSYAQDAGAVGVGSTGGGVTIGGTVSGDVGRLDWDTFARDLRLAARWVQDIHIFSLEGCVRQGFLPRLKAFDWSAPVEPPVEQALEVDRVRRALHVALWLSAHPAVIAIGLLGAVASVAQARRRARIRPPLVIDRPARPKGR